MSIMKRIDLKKVRQDPNVFAFFIVWLSLSIVTLLAFYFNIKALSNIDVPTHIGAGLVIAAFIFSTVKVKSGKQALAIAFIPFITWEITEVIISSYAHNPFIFRLFHETVQNHIQDVAMDTLGFLVFIKMTARKFW